MAARAGHVVGYMRASRLFESLAMARADGSHLRLMQKYGRIKLLIIADFLTTPLQEKPCGLQRKIRHFTIMLVI